ncbi:MAG: ParB/RepB/Spo0J family partition protein [Rikenellaceae bacterium]|nr:ParB/RepB/Spo0J family partition protein [Rikenellaceae bacterium]
MKSTTKQAPVKKTRTPKKSATVKTTPTTKTENTVDIDSLQTEIVEMELEKINPSINNPRSSFEQSKITELAESIKKIGLISEIGIRQIPETDKYEIVYGERRFRAFQILKRKTIPAKIIRTTDSHAQDIAVVENIQREDLTPFELAVKFKSELNGGNDYKSLSVKYGKSVSYIRLLFNLNDLIPDFVDLLKADEINITSALEIAKYSPQLQTEMYRDHFAVGCFNSWRGNRTKEIARNLNKAYTTRLDEYFFDKSDCASCKNYECLSGKNTRYIYGKVKDAIEKNPSYLIGHEVCSDKHTLEKLEADGCEMIDIYEENFDVLSNEPVQLKKSDFKDKEKFRIAQAKYDKELKEWISESEEAKKNVDTGKARYCVVVDDKDVYTALINLEKEEDEVESDVFSTGQPQINVASIPENESEATPDEEKKITIEPDPVKIQLDNLLNGIKTLENSIPKFKKLRKEEREKTKHNKELLYKNIFPKMREILYDYSMPDNPLSELEEKLTYFIMINSYPSCCLWQLGYEKKHLQEPEIWEIVCSLTPEQMIIVQRSFIFSTFNASRECNWFQRELLFNFSVQHNELKTKVAAAKHMDNFNSRQEKIEKAVESFLKQEEENKIKIEELKQSARKLGYLFDGDPEPVQEEPIEVEEPEIPLANDPEDEQKVIIPIPPDNEDFEEFRAIA